MAGTVLELPDLIRPDNLASHISNKYNEWSSFRNEWIEEKKELRNYIYATDTTTTTNKKLPWSNSTTTPKLTQIYDNLKANYSAALFPRSKWIRWEGGDQNAVVKEKRDIIQAYMDNKVQQSRFRFEADRLVDDFILFGNCFATVKHVVEYEEVDGDTIPQYIGPKLQRISPFDIVFNPTASEFSKSPKIIRSVKTLGEVKDMIDSDTFEKIKNNRTQVGSGVDVDKADGFIADGFNSIQHYYESNYVELLTFYGDIYDSYNDDLMTNKKVVIVDRAYVISNEDIASWLGRDPVFHAGWRDRPDNLYSMGPLDNLVGLQYRIDHLENLKADVFDQIALPMVKIYGEVQDFTYQPGERIYIGDAQDGEVSYLAPDATALNADFQIQTLENKMEELAGAPRQAMGIRTPGEKTAYEVQRLENAAGRIFQHKAAKLEMEFFEPILNTMLESGRRNMDANDLIRVLDDETGAIIFSEITKEDITAKGKITPVGARHFAERAQRVQDITQMLQVKQIPDIGVHLSGKKIAEILANELGESEIYGENISLKEQADTQEVVQNLEVSNVERLSAAEEGGF